MSIGKKGKPIERQGRNQEFRIYKTYHFFVKNAKFSISFFGGSCSSVSTDVFNCGDVSIFWILRF